MLTLKYDDSKMVMMAAACWAQMRSKRDVAHCLCTGCVTATFPTKDKHLILYMRKWVLRN